MRHERSPPLSSRSLSHQQPGLFRLLLPLDRIPHFPVGIPASNPWRADGVRRFGLADLSFAIARNLSVPFQSGPPHPRRRSADTVAPRGLPDRSTFALVPL